MRQTVTCFCLAVTGVAVALGLMGCGGGGAAQDSPGGEAPRIRDFRGDGGGAGKPLPDFVSLQPAATEQEKWGATAIGPWSPPHEFRVAEGRVQWYEVRVLSEGGRWVATLQPTTDDRDCDLFVFEPAGQGPKDQLDLIAYSNRAPAQGTNPSDWVSWRQETLGRHQMGVTGYDAAGAQPPQVPYTMEIDRVRKLEVNGDWQGPAPMEGGLLAAPGSDWFWFSAVAGEPYQVILRSNTGDADLFVYEGTASELVGSSTQPSPVPDQVWFAAQRSGLHHVRVYAVTDCQYCAYVQEGDTADEWAYEVSHHEVPDLPAEEQPPDIPVFINGCLAGEGNLVALHHRAGQAESWPAVLALYSSGYLRLTPATDPPTSPGTSIVLGPAYWEAGQYHHYPVLSEIRITGDLHAGASLALTAAGVNGKLSVEYELTVKAPSATSMTCQVSQTATCNQALTVDATRQGQHQGYKLVQFSSMYIDGEFHDADALHYPAASRYRRKDLAEVVDGLVAGQERFIFSATEPLGQAWVEMAHFAQSGWQGPTPSVALNLISAPPLGKCTPQGRVRVTVDPNEDNVGAWVNWDGAPTNWAAGTQRSIEYEVAANAAPHQ